jgi:hypothetical protein
VARRHGSGQLGSGKWETLRLALSRSLPRSSCSAQGWQASAPFDAASARATLREEGVPRLVYLCAVKRRAPRSMADAETCDKGTPLLRPACEGLI